MFGLGKKKAAATGAISVKFGENPLLIQISTAGFRVVDPSAQPKETWSGDTSKLTEQGIDRAEKSIQLALDAVPKRVLKRTGSIVLLLGDQDFLYTDTRSSTLSTASAERAREFGKSLLGVPSVTYGKLTFGPTEGAGRRRGEAYVFADASAIQRLLAVFGEYCDRITAIVPDLSVPILRTRGRAEGTYGAIKFGSSASSIVLGHWQHQALVVRQIPVGLATIVNAAAKGSGLSVEEISKTLLARDYLSALQLDGPDDPGAGPLEHAMAEQVRRLGREIQSTLDYFEEQQGCGRPDIVELFGEHASLKALDKWLSNAVGIDIKPHSKSLFDLLLAAPDAEVMNMLSGLEGNPISVGKSYLQFNGKNLVRAAGDKGGGPKLRSGESSPGSRRRARRSGRRQPSQGLLARLLPKQLRVQQMAQGGTSNQIWGVVFFALIAASLYYAYDGVYVGSATRYERMASGYSAAARENARLRQEVADFSRGALSSPDVDKVLWTEKFLAIGKHMNEALWLTDVYLSDQGRAGNVGQKLIIEGAALPSTDGHIFEVANYIERLEDDVQRFMNDFSEISFEGATIDEQDGGNIIRFTLAARYDQGKRGAASE